MSKYRSRNHMLLLYPENAEHLKAYEIIQKSFDYLSILHNRDITEDGEIKKEHLHIILRFTQPRWSSSICKELGIAENYIEDVKKLENAMQYLLHFNDPDKAQYTVEEVQGTFKNRLIESLNKINKNEGEKVHELIEFIQSYDKKLTITEFAKFCALNGYWAEFRRSGSIFLKIIEEHNTRIEKKD